MPKLRLINPRNPLNGLVQNDVARRVTFGRKAIFMPLGLMVAAGTVPRSFQKWAWIINISINQGFRYYYRRRKKRMPDFQEAHLWAAEAPK